MRSIKRQINDLRPIVLWAYVPSAILILLVLGLSSLTGIPVGEITRDPLAVMGGDFYVGSISNLGILLWCATATICFFTAALIGKSEEASKTRSFLLFGGLLTTLLCLDDLFMLHEFVFPRYFHWKQGIIVLSYGLLLLAYLWSFRKRVLDSHFLLLVLASGFFGVSVLVDRLPEYLLPGFYYLVEDGSKLLGIVSWFAYYLVF
ncbi:MAG: hypothetical protein WBG01_04260, partial [Bacteroidota bacterium]